MGLRERFSGFGALLFWVWGFQMHSQVSCMFHTIGRVHLRVCFRICCTPSALRGHQSLKILTVRPATLFPVFPRTLVPCHRHCCGCGQGSGSADHGRTHIFFCQHAARRARARGCNRWELLWPFFRCINNMCRYLSQSSMSAEHRGSRAILGAI